jgi:hypothetical protein
VDEFRAMAGAVALLDQSLTFPYFVQLRVVPLFGASSADNLPGCSQRLGDNARNPNASSGPLSASSATRSAPVTPTTSAYLVAKYLEISACGSIVSGSIPGQGLLVWCDCGLLLDESMSDGEILGLIDTTLADKDAPA